MADPAPVQDESFPEGATSLNRRTLVDACLANRDVTIRTVKVEDLGQIRMVERASFPDPYPQLRFLMLHFKAREGFIVACKDGIVGYAISEIRGGRGHIISMAVSPESRGSGIGEALLEESIRRLDPRVNEIYLEVREDNQAAIRLYEKFSFRRTGEFIERYYPGGEAAVVMLRSSPKAG